MAAVSFSKIESSYNWAANWDIFTISVHSEMPNAWGGRHYRTGN